MSATSASLSVILIHGAFTNSSCWSKVLLGLRARGIRGTATHCPLTSLTHDAAAAQRGRHLSLAGQRHADQSDGIVSKHQQNSEDEPR